MIKAENGRLTMAGSFKELTTEVSRVVDAIAYKISTDFNNDLDYDDVLEFLLNAVDMAKREREEGTNVRHSDMSKELKVRGSITAEDADAIGEIVSKGVEKGWLTEKIDKKIGKYLEKKGIEFKKPKAKKKMTKKEKKADKKNQKKVDELFDPKNFPYVNPAKFKKGDK